MTLIDSIISSLSGKRGSSLLIAKQRFLHVDFRGKLSLVSILLSKFLSYLLQLISELKDRVATIEDKFEDMEGKVDTLHQNFGSLGACVSYSKLRM